MKLYLAYGANTNFPQMAVRCPAAKYVCNLTLGEHRLVFRGVADVVSAKGRSVETAAWLITEACELALDRFEGFPQLYVKKYVNVQLNGRTHRAMFYVMRNPAERGESQPYSSYESCLREGYTNCGMDTAQIDRAMAEVTAWQKTARSKASKQSSGGSKWKPTAKTPSGSHWSDPSWGTLPLVIRNQAPVGLGRLETQAEKERRLQREQDTRLSAQEEAYFRSLSYTYARKDD